MKFLRRKKVVEIFPEEIFLDARNLPEFDTERLEGHMEQPISRRVFMILGSVLALISLIFIIKLTSLQVVRGEQYALRSESNSLSHTSIYSERGVIYDRNGVELAWNTPERTYITESGFGHTLGYVGYPTQDEISNEGYGPKENTGKEGAESYFNDILKGQKGTRILEIDVQGNIQSESVLNQPIDGEELTLSIDHRVQNKLYEIIADLARDRGFSGGAGVIMDVHSGELLAITSFPEYDPNILSGDTDPLVLNAYNTDEDKPFLNRVAQGLYTPGSIIKPYVALAALAEEVIDPKKQILSTGSISIPNPYFPENPTIFTDWKAHGWVDMIDALAYSSNVYFYEVGGGFEEQNGIGIDTLSKYLRDFGFEEMTNSSFYGEKIGVIPTPKWKKEVFDDDWRIGDTYNTAIGQYGFQVTPVQVVRAVGALANSGRLYTPTLMADKGSKYRKYSARIDKEDFETVRSGMRAAVKYGTASGLNVGYVAIAAKTGTAELGTGKRTVNSWVTGFFPYDSPRYAFVVVMEKGPRANTIGGVFVMRSLFDWMRDETPEYLEG